MNKKVVDFTVPFVTCTVALIVCSLGIVTSYISYNNGKKVGQVEKIAEQYCSKISEQNCLSSYCWKESGAFNCTSQYIKDNKTVIYNFVCTKDECKN
jgi:hypothetical protein